MIITYDTDNLKKRLKTGFLVDEKMKFYSIYDFAYKYRTRIFNDKNEEVAYVEKDILQADKVDLFDRKGNRLDTILKIAEGYKSDEYLYEGDIDNGEIKDLFANTEGKLTIFDDKSLLFVIMFITGLAEMMRED